MNPTDLAQSFYDAIAAGDVEKVMDVLHPDINWTEAEGFPYYDGTWTSPQQVVENLLVPLGRDWEAFSVLPGEFFADGSVVVCLGTYTATNRATGKAMRSPFMHRWEVRDGKLKQFDMLADTVLVDRAVRIDA